MTFWLALDIRIWNILVFYLSIHAALSWTYVSIGMQWIHRNHFICVQKSLCKKLRHRLRYSSAIFSNLLSVMDIIFKSIPFHINNLLCAIKIVSSYVITCTVQEWCQTICKILAVGTMCKCLACLYLYHDKCDKIIDCWRSNIP